MKLTIPIILLSLVCLNVPAADKLDAMLQKGLFEEEGNQNLETAIQVYQSLVAAHDNDRKTAATAIYRLGECYRKLGRTNEAISQFQRILASFSDQPTLAMLSRQNLVGLGAAEAPSSASSLPAGASRRSSLQQSLAASRAEAAAATALHQRLHELSQGELQRTLLTVVPDEPLSRLLEQSAQIEQKLASLSAQFSNEHPSVVAEMKTKATVEKQIAERTEGILRGLQLQAATAQRRVETLEAEMNATENRSDAGVSGRRVGAMGESSRAKMKEMLQQELQISENLLKEQKKKIEVGTSAPGDDARLERDVLSVRRQLLAVDGLPAPTDRKEWRELLLKEIRFAEQAADIEKKKLDVGRSTVAEVAPLQRDVLALKRELLEFDSRLPEPAATTTNAAAALPGSVTTEEEEEIRKIKSIINNSPDLINTPNSGMSPLHQAAVRGQLVVARFLLDNGALVDQPAPQIGQSPLEMACEQGHKAMAELLLSRGANPNHHSNNGDTALHLAARKGFVSVADALFRHKAELEAKNGLGETPLHAATSWRSAMTEVLLKHGANANAVRDDSKTPLHIAATAGHVDIARMLLAHGANPNATAKEGVTPMFLAMTSNAGGRREKSDQRMRDRIEMVRLLLEKGARTDQGPSGMPAMHQAILADSTELVQLLLARGLKPEGTDSGGLTPLQYAVVNQRSAQLIPLLVKAGANPNERIKSSSSERTRDVANNEFEVKDQHPLTIALRKGDFAMTEALLQNGADVNAVNPETGATAAMQALWGNPSLLNLVLRYKPDLSIQTKSEGKTILHWAVANTAYENRVPDLLKAGAPVNVASFSGWTPLHYAALVGNVELTELLLKNGANPNAIAADGKLPLILAYRPGPGSSGSPKVAELLLKYGADELLVRRQTISVNRSGRNFEQTIFRKGTNELNRYSLFELFATLYAGGGQLSFPELRQVTIERLQPDRSTRSIPVNFLELTQGGNVCTNDLWLQWGDRIEIPETDHALSESWRGLPFNFVQAVGNCLDRTVEIQSKDRSNRYQLRAIKSGYAYFVMDSFRLFDVIRKSGDKSFDGQVRVTRQNPEQGQPIVMEFSKQPEKDFDLWLRDGDKIEVLGK